MACASSKGTELKWFYNFDLGVVILNSFSKFAFKTIARRMNMLNSLLPGPQIDILLFTEFIPFHSSTVHRKFRKCYISLLEKKISIFLDV